MPTRVGYDFIGWTQKKSSNTLKNLSVSGKESSHNYENNSNKTWTISCFGANSISITFDPLTEFETNCDYLYIFDGSDNQIGKYSGTELSGKTIVVNDDYVSLRLTSDYSNTKWGFSVTEAVASITETSIGNVEYLPGDIYTINEPLSLYAVWETKKYHISFDANGGTGAPSSQIKTYDTDLTLSSIIPVREGYNFLGWSDSPAATSASYNAGGIYTDTSDEDVTLYAVWQLKTYTVFYNANGGSSVPSSQTKGYFDDLVLATPTRTGYTFKGWSTSYGGNVVYTSGSTYTTNQNLILYAVWEINKYTVSYNANGGTGATSSQTKTYGTTITLSNILFAREGYNFLGWSTNRNGNIESKKSLSVSGLESAHNYANNTNKSWTVLSSGAQSIQLIFDSRTELENNYDKLYIYDRNNIQVGIYTGTQLAGKTITVDGDKVVLKLVSDPSQNRWGFKVTSAYAIQEKLYEPGDSYTITSDVVFYAIWQLKTYSVNYNANGGIRGPSSQTKKYFDNLVLSSSVPTRTGYTFKGWARAADGEVEFHPGDIYTANEAMTLYAVWEVKKYIVSYDANGGVGTPENQEKTYGIDITLSTLVPEREGYNFKGWSKSSTSTSASYSAGSIYTDNSNYVDVTLYAVWIEKTYSVTYNPNGGSNAPSSQSKYYFSDLALRTNLPTKSNYVFVGWSTTSNGKVEYLPGDTYTLNEPTTLYAKWVKKDGVTFDGVTNAVAGQEISYDIYVSSSHNLDYLISTIKYSKHFTVKEIVNKDFEDNVVDTQYHDDEYNYITIISTFDFAGLRTQVNKGYIPFEIVFSVAENCPLGTHTISFSEGTIGVGDEDYHLVFEEVSVFVPDTLTIYGDDEISDESQYTVRGVNSIDVPVVWTVDDKTVATISDDGVLTPIVNGTVVITATYTENNTIFATKTVTIKDNDVTAIDIIGADTVYDGEKYAVKLYPESLNHKTVTWSVDDETVATITEDGVLTAVRAGTVNVTATVSDATQFSKSITVTIPSVDAVIDNLSTDVGTWDKEFVPYEREYTIIVQAIVDSISITGSYSSGSLKCDGLVLMNGRAKTIELSEDVTTLTFERGDVSGKNDSEYVITVIKMHSYGDWTVTTEPTCTEAGEKKIICTVCGDVKETEVIPELGHDWSEWEEIKAPTYVETGIKSRTCSVCGETEERDIDVIPFIDVESISLNKADINLNIGDTVNLVTTITPEDASDKTITWTSSNTNVATVDKNGIVMAIAKGSATITATSHNDVSATCEINVGVVADKVEFTSIKTTFVAVGKSITLKATASRIDGLKPQSTAVTYEIVEGKELATIDAKGKLAAKAVGEVVVRATADVGTEEAYAEITINICIPATKVTLNTTKASMIVGGEDLNLSAEISPENNTDTLTWSVDKPDIARVEENGVVTALKAGKVKVTAMAGSGKKATCSVTIGEPATKVEFTSLKSTSLAVGKTLTLKAKASRDDKVKPVSTNVVYEIIEGEEFATIDAKGKLKGIATGEVVVRATAEAGTEDAHAEVVINVCIPATKVKLNMTKASMIVGGEDLYLSAEISPEDNTDTLTWSVDKEDIATVDENGVVTALKTGKVKVTAMTGSGKKATCTVTIGEPATKVVVTALKTTSVAVGKSITLKGKAACEGKTKPVSTAVVFDIIEGDDIATIDAKGKLTAKAEGTVVVRISAEAGTEEAYEDVEIRICNLATKVTLNMTKATIAVDDELQLEATMTAKGECTDTLTWSVDKPNIATVDENGLVTAHSAGKVKVTATSGSGKKATCTVTVSK